MPTLFLCGDVMTGRGIDQILPHPSAPHLYESYVKSALTYVDLARRAHGPIPRPVDFSYIWGDALAVLDRVRPHARIVNLETAVTTSEDAWPDKGIHYRMHPDNAPCLSAAGVDCCVLANNHVLDWGHAGLLETLQTVGALGMRSAGAGGTAAEATAPAVLDVAPGARVLVFARCVRDSGVPAAWAAQDERGGVGLLPALSPATADAIGAQVAAHRCDGDIVVVSIHWGGNWGYRISAKQRAFAQRLIDRAQVDIVHGHSSHHVKGIERYRDKLILYGCGDFINDYEGIGGYDEYHPDLAVMYFARIDAADGRLLGLTLVPTRMRRFRLEAAPEDETRWLLALLNREGRDLGTRFESADGGLSLVNASVS
jgi:poly-gamma-glutamate synthesis protein (capsule biosynthesis protein)